MPDDVRPGVAPLASMVADLPCAVCGKQSAHVELVAPGELPAGWAEWDRRRQESYKRHHDPTQWQFIYDGPASGSGDGHDISIVEAARIAAAFTPPVRVCRVHDDARFYDSAGLLPRTLARDRIPYRNLPLGPYQEPRSTLVTRRLVTLRHRVLRPTVSYCAGRV
jgi:hypothetical protein